MPRLALAVCMLWFVSLFVVRSVMQWRRTGSTGIKGFHGRVPSLPWCAGVATSLGMALAVVAPLATLLGWPGGSLLELPPLMHAAGAIAAMAGTAGALLAQLGMGESWRVGVDESEKTQLVTTGLFAWVRNPIFSFMGLSAFGLLLLVPSVWTSVALALAALGIDLQVRFVEEPHLGRMHGDAYASYATRTGRFLPGIGRMHEDGRKAPQTHSADVG